MIIPDRESRTFRLYYYLIIILKQRMRFVFSVIKIRKPLKVCVYRDDSCYISVRSKKLKLPNIAIQTSWRSYCYSNDA
jgi:hypothetical protein